MASDLFGSRLQIDVSSRDGEIRIALHGELDIGNAPEVEEALLTAEAAEAPIIRLDLRELQFLDSTGLRVILSAQLRAAVDNDRLRVTPGPERVQRLFAMTGTTDLLHFEDEGDPPDNVVGMPPDGG
jgi:anti-sigma B factor antagonist